MTLHISSGNGFEKHKSSSTSANSVIGFSSIVGGNKIILVRFFESKEMILSCEQKSVSQTSAIYT